MILLIIILIVGVCFFALYMFMKDDVVVPPIKYRYYKNYFGKYVVEHYSEYRGWTEYVKKDTEENAKNFIDACVSLDKYDAAPKEYKYYNGETE